MKISFFIRLLSSLSSFLLLRAPVTYDETPKHSVMLSSLLRLLLKLCKQYFLLRKRFSFAENRVTTALRRTCQLLGGRLRLLGPLCRCPLSDCPEGSVRYRQSRWSIVTLLTLYEMIQYFGQFQMLLAGWLRIDYIRKENFGVQITAIAALLLPPPALISATVEWRAIWEPASGSRSGWDLAKERLKEEETKYRRPS